MRKRVAEKQGVNVKELEVLETNDMKEMITEMNRKRGTNNTVCRGP